MNSFCSFFKIILFFKSAWLKLPKFWFLNWISGCKVFSIFFEEVKNWTFSGNGKEASKIFLGRLFYPYFALWYFEYSDRTFRNQMEKIFTFKYFRHDSEHVYFDFFWQQCSGIILLKARFKLLRIYLTPPAICDIIVV